MRKKERPHMEIYYQNVTKKGADWPKIVKDLKLHVIECDDENLDILKWEILRYKKNSDVNNIFSIYMMALALLSIIFSMVSQVSNVKSSAIISFATFLFGIVLIVLILLIPLFKDIASYTRDEHYFDIYFRIIEEEIDRRAKKKEQDERQKDRDARLEYVIKILDNRSPFWRLVSIFKSK